MHTPPLEITAYNRPPQSPEHPHGEPHAEKGRAATVPPPLGGEVRRPTDLNCTRTQKSEVRPACQTTRRQSPPPYRSNCRSDAKIRGAPGLSDHSEAKFAALSGLNCTRTQKFEAPGLSDYSDAKARHRPVKTPSDSGAKQHDDKQAVTAYNVTGKDTGKRPCRQERESLRATDSIDMPTLRLPNHPPKRKNA